MKLDREEVLRRLKGLAAQAADLQAMIKEKGPKHFARPLVTAGAVIFAVHRFVYVAPVTRLGHVDKEISAARASAQFKDRYLELDGNLKAFYSTLPNPKEAEAWLLQSVREAMRAEGIEFTQLSPPQERVSGGFRFISMMVKCRANYKQVGAWIARLESSKQLLRVTRLVIVKDAQETGMNNVDLTVATVVPGGSSR